MEIFKNKVGRPSNETLAKRKKIKISITVSVIILLGLVGVLGYKSFFISNKIIAEEKNVNFNSTTYTVKGENSGINVNAVEYNKGKEVPESKIKSYLIFGAADGTTKVSINITFPNVMHYFGYEKYYFSVVQYNKQNKQIKTIGLSEQITKTKYSRQVQITSDTYYVVLYVKTVNGKNVYSKRIYLTTRPSVIAKLKTAGAEKVESNANLLRATVPKAGDYYTDVTIKNPKKIGLYYRWVTYPDYAGSKVGYIDKKCIKITKDTPRSVGLAVNDKMPQRLGRFEIYSTEWSCNQRTGAIAKFNVKYEMARTYNNNDGWQMLKYDIKKISQTLGSQPKAECLSTALAYGVYILSNGTKIKSTSASSTSYGAIDKSHSTKAQFFSTVKQKIDAGIPVVMKAKNNTGPYYQHFVLIVGYNRNKSVSTMGLGDIWVIDPYYDKAPHYNLKNIVLHENRASKRTGTIKDFYSGYPVKTWATTTSYK